MPGGRTRPGLGRATLERNALLPEISRPEGSSSVPRPPRGALATDAFGIEARRVYVTRRDIEIPGLHDALRWSPGSRR